MKVIWSNSIAEHYCKFTERYTRSWLRPRLNDTWYLLKTHKTSIKCVFLYTFRSMDNDDLVPVYTHCNHNSVMHWLVAICDNLLQYTLSATHTQHYTIYIPHTIISCTGSSSDSIGAVSNVTGGLPGVYTSRLMFFRSSKIIPGSLQAVIENNISVRNVVTANAVWHASSMLVSPNCLHIRYIRDDLCRDEYTSYVTDATIIIGAKMMVYVRSIQNRSGPMWHVVGKYPM